MLKNCQKIYILSLCLAFIAAMASVAIAVDGANSSPTRLDVNDISILWPVPKSSDDLNKLIALDEKLADGISTICPENAFQQLVTTAQGVNVSGSAGNIVQIKFRNQKAAFESATNWIIAGIRIDPSAPGCDKKLIAAFGSTPQIRLIVQPVTRQGEKVIVHDVTAHLVYSFVAGIEPATASGLPARVNPDKAKFKIVLDDLATLKAELLAAGINSDGELSVHPAFASETIKFPEKLRVFLKKHLSAEQLSAMAFMGIDSPEPWIFFAMVKQEGKFVRTGHPTLGTEQAQMLTFRGGDKVMPHPKNSTFGNGFGVSTSVLFEPVNLDGLLLPGGEHPATFREIPDIVANPQISHFFNTDCVSCHSESTRRSNLSLQGTVSPFQFQRPAGISGVNDAVLAKHEWNVRNFGWFPDFFNEGKAVESVSMRTANEAAESAAFINREYFTNTPEPVMTKNVTNALTLVMTIKSPDDKVKLKQLITSLQQLPPEKNPIAVALTKLGNVHFARFVFIGDDQLAVITSYDNDFETYILSFVDELGEVFDKLLVHIKDAPPLPVKEHPEAFLEFVKKRDLICEPPFYSAYPTLKVQDILTLQKKATEPTSNPRQ
ncbi:MAG: hypothetical protein SFX18_17595 [Pirellulales bacterium]|nr:hypothetical protein [Pirellulales bacterium]